MRTGALCVVFAMALGLAPSARQPTPVPVAKPAAARATPPLPSYDAPNLEARLAEASARARENNRRVLIVWGSNAEEASRSLAELTVRDSEVSRKLQYEYDVIRADPAGNAALAATLGAEVKRGALPRLTVLDADGRVLASETAAAFAASPPASSPYDSKALVAFLAKHQAAYVDAEPLLAGALSRAKKEQKTLFLWFSAPW